jgi:hypothetical protein
MVAQGIDGRRARSRRIDEGEQAAKNERKRFGSSSSNVVVVVVVVDVAG